MRYITYKRWSINVTEFKTEKEFKEAYKGVVPKKDLIEFIKLFNDGKRVLRHGKRNERKEPKNEVSRKGDAKRTKQRPKNIHKQESGKGTVLPKTTTVPEVG